MSKNKTLIVLLLDRTGSMESCKAETISGFNAYIIEQRGQATADLVRFTLIQFDSVGMDRVHEAVSLPDVVLLNDKTYQPRAYTPLYDALGYAIKSTEEFIAKTRGYKTANVLMVIQTDGYENWSKEYSQEQIRSLIQNKERAGWSFVYLGADHDAIAQSASVGIDPSNTLNYKGAQAGDAFSSLSSSTSCYLSSTPEEQKATRDFWKKPQVL